MLFECAGAADGGVQHCCAGLEAELLRHVRAGAEQCHHERLPTQGKDTHIRLLRRRCNIKRLITKSQRRVMNQ